MTLIASEPPAIAHDYAGFSPLHSLRKPFGFTDALVQCVGYQDGNVVPQIGQIAIENSSDVHFGDKNIYQGPVTISQIVYTSGVEKGKENLGFEKEADDGGEEGAKKCPKDKGQEENVGFRKGFVWFEKFVKYRQMEMALFLGLVVLFVIIVLMVVFLQHPRKTLPKGINSEPDLIQPINYNPDISDTSILSNKIRIVSRYEWLAQPPLNETTPLVTPVPYVIIHHTATVNCSSQAQCVFQVRHIQTFHIEGNGWYDIGYNFLVGGDGAAYEGRGWEKEGAHTLGWNLKSIGIAFIGTFISQAPPNVQIVACQKVINRGIELGFIRADYKLLGARQLFGTESPGTALYERMKNWTHYAEVP